MSSPYIGPIVDLVDPYLTADTKKNGGFKHKGGEYQDWWLRTHPGRWALIGQDGMGLTREWAHEHGYKHATRNSYQPNQRIYAQNPHPEGESFLTAYKRMNQGVELYIPELTTSEFGWTPAELAEACQIARDNLFPVGE